MAGRDRKGADRIGTEWIVVVWKTEGDGINLGFLLLTILGKNGIMCNINDEGPSHDIGIEEADFGTTL